VERFAYAFPFAPDYHVNVVFRGAEVTNVEFDDSYLGPLTLISEKEAMNRLH